MDFNINITDVLKTFQIETSVLYHMLYDYNSVITGSIIPYCFHKWEDFNSDLDIWIPFTEDFEIQRGNVSRILKNFGYELVKTDISNPSDPSEFAQLINIVEHYVLTIEDKTKVVDIVYLKKTSIDEVLIHTDLKLCMNYAKVELERGILKFKLVSCDRKSYLDLTHKILTVNINFDYLNPYEANKKITRFYKYLSRGFICNPVIQNAYHELLEHFINQYNPEYNYRISQFNGYGMSFRIISLIREIKQIYDTLFYIEEHRVFPKKQIKTKI